MGISRKQLADLVEKRLRDNLTNATVYRGEVPDKPPVIQTAGKDDPSGRIAPYVVLYTGAGNPTVEADLGRGGVELDWSFQTNCVAGYDADCGRLVDRVTDLLFRWVPQLDGHAFGLIEPPPGFDPGPIRRQDLTGIPPRFFAPLQWRLSITTS